MSRQPKYGVPGITARDATMIIHPHSFFARARATSSSGS
jgi:hypothetical protein